MANYIRDLRPAKWGAHVRFGSLADIEARPRNVRFTPKADMDQHRGDVRFVPIAVLESRLLQTSTYCALWTVFPNVILGLRKPIAIQAAISFNINLPE